MGKGTEKSVGGRSAGAGLRAITLGGMVRRLIRWPVYGLSALLVAMNACVHHRPDYRPMEGVWPNEDLIQQVEFLETALRGGAAAEMQSLYPEGRLFMNAISRLAADAVPIYRWNYTHRETARDTADRYLFPADLPLRYGAFYRGWRQYAFRNDDSIVEDVAQALQRSSTPFLESYHRSAWPADMVVLMASLQPRHPLPGSDDLGRRRYVDSLRQHWVAAVRTRLDPRTGMIPHAVDPTNGHQLEGPRGSSMALMVCLLPEIDTAFARQQYALFKQHFLTDRIGFPAFREYPRGTQGRGDVDSGPVVWGVGAVASIVGQRACGLYGDYGEFIGLRGAIQAFGLATTWRGKRQYLMGQLPIVDAFTAWANSVDAYRGPIDQTRITWVPWTFHGLSLLIWLFLFWIGYRTLPPAAHGSRATHPVTRP